MPRTRLTRRRAIAFALFVLASIAFLYFVLPQISGAGRSTRSRAGTAAAAVALGFQVLAMASFVAIFHGVQVPRDSRLTHGDSDRSRWRACGHAPVRRRRRRRRGADRVGPAARGMKRRRSPSA